MRRSSSASSSGESSRPRTASSFSTERAIQRPSFQNSPRTPSPSGETTVRTTRPSNQAGPASTEPGSLGAIDETSSRIIAQRSNDAAENTRLAAEIKADLDQQLTEVVSDVSGAEFESTRVKDDGSGNPSPRLIEKINSGKGKPANTITDYLAGRIIIDTIDATDELVEAIRTRFRIIEDDDFLFQGKPEKGGHRARNLQIEVAPGFSAEIQIQARETFDIRHQTHALYEQMRRPGASPDEYEAAQQKALDLNEEAFERFLIRSEDAAPEPSEPVNEFDKPLDDHAQLMARTFIDRRRGHFDQQMAGLDANRLAEGDRFTIGEAGAIATKVFHALRRQLPAGQPARGSSAAKPANATPGVGRFRVIGVDKETQYDTTIVVEAATEANAKVKAELQGVIVTEVQRVE